MKKTLPAIILALALLCACGGAGNTVEPAPEPEQTPAVSAAPEPEPEGFRFTRGNFPRLDGSTSTAPLAEAVCMELLGVTGEQAAELVSFSKTTGSYYQLIYDLADLLIVAEANDEVLAEKESRGFEWEKTPFATDAFIFVVNEDNPVDSITVDEARKIYSGEITNWAQLGGEDREIIPFQRNQGAGSQTLMEKLVMAGEPMTDAPTDYIIGSMGELMEAVKGYDGTPGAIGYSVYYYAEEMRMAQGLKILAVDGVEPVPDTIRAGSYPLTNPYYVVISADAPEGSSIRELYNWLLSEPGQRLAAREGYVSIMDVGVEGRPAPEPEVGTRRYEQYTDYLIPSGDYGRLIPYAGQRLSDGWWVSTGCLYGLMTARGEVVTDPVYSNVYAPGYPDGGKWGRFPLLILVQGYDGLNGWGESRLSVAASDGSWCTDSDYDAVTDCTAVYLVLLRGGQFDLMLPDGTVERTVTRAQAGMTAEQWEEMREQLIYGEGVGGQLYGDYLTLYCNEDDRSAETVYRCYDLSSQKAVDMLARELWDMADDGGGEYEPEPPSNADPIYDRLSGHEAPPLLHVREYTENGIVLSYAMPDGTPIPWLTDGSWPRQIDLVGGLIEVLDLNEAAYYDLETMECVFRTYLSYEQD